MRDSELVKLVKVGMKENYADIMTKNLDPDIFTTRRECSMIEQSPTSSSTTTEGVVVVSRDAGTKAGTSVATELNVTEDREGEVAVAASERGGGGGHVNL